MIESYKNKANLGIGLGLVLSVGGRVFIAMQTPAAGVAGGASPALILGAVAASLLGTGLFIYGCVMYALGKNRNGAWGIFGLLSIIGLIVLVCLRDDAPDGRKPEQRGFEVNPPPRPPLG